MKRPHRKEPNSRSCPKAQHMARLSGLSACFWSWHGLVPAIQECAQTE
nr:MAG TPA: hypothetical protein [Caudoviricetes sp.]